MNQAVGEQDVRKKEQRKGLQGLLHSLVKTGLLRAGSLRGRMEALAVIQSAFGWLKPPTIDGLSVGITRGPIGDCARPLCMKHGIFTTFTLSFPSDNPKVCKAKVLKSETYWGLLILYIDWLGWYLQQLVKEEQTKAGTHVPKANLINNVIEMSLVVPSLQ